MKIDDINIKLEDRKRLVIIGVESPSFNHKIPKTDKSTNGCLTVYSSLNHRLPLKQGLHHKGFFIILCQSAVGMSASQVEVWTHLPGAQLP